MTATNQQTSNHATMNLFLSGPQQIEPKFYSEQDDRYGPRGVVTLDGGAVDVSVFVESREQAAAIAQAFHDLMVQFPVPDAQTYPARMVVHQRDAADPESWVYLCNEGHTDAAVLSEGPSPWLSLDHAGEGAALIGAADHARAVHDMALPADLAERARAAERAAAERAAAERMAPSGPSDVAGGSYSRALD